MVRRRRARASPSPSAPTGWAPLVAFGLGGFAAGSALRQVVLATRRQGWRGLVGRANGGMIVHIGVIVIAVALAASNSYTRSATLTLDAGVPVAFGGHTFELQSTSRSRENDRERVVDAPTCCVDGDTCTARRPPRYLASGEDVPTPSVRHRAHQGHLPDAGQLGRRR